MSAPDLLSAVLHPGGAGAPEVSAAPRDRQQVQALAQEFESMLLLQVMRQVRETLSAWGGDDEGGQGDVLSGDLGPLSDTLDGELARYLSKSGGLGLSPYLANSLSKIPGAAPTAPPDPLLLSPAVPAAVASAVAMPDPAAVPATFAPAELVSPASRSILPSLATDGVPEAAQPGKTDSAVPFANPVVTSPFGWRSDPLTHAPRFHEGVDIRAAYGQNVPAAAAGRVTLAREQGDYGLTVVISHPDGFQTRYAHLSSINVTEGDQVTANQTIGLVGRSGRATAPHLHFELTHNGVRVDPTSSVQGRAFKESAARADLTSSSPSTRLAATE